MLMLTGGNIIIRRLFLLSLAVSFLLFQRCMRQYESGRTGDKELPAGDAESGTCAAGTNKTSTDTVSVPDGNDMTNDEGSSGSDPDAGGNKRP